MREHAYSNATTADLWRALGTASGKPVASIASSYTEQPGVPLVVAEARCQGGQQRIILRQDRFSVRDPSAKPQQWQIPMRFGRINGARAGDTILLDRSAEFAAGACGEPVKLNLGDVGYYRVRYDGAMQSALARALPTLAPLDRVNLLADTWALVESGRSAPAAYFELADQLGGDDNRTVVEQVIRTLARIDQLERGQPGRAAFRAFARSALRPTFDRLGWQATAGESNDRVLLRARLIRVLGDLGDEAIIAEAKHRFAAFLADPESLPPSLREPVTHLVGRTADRAMYDTLLGLARKTTNTDERSRYYSALASSSDPALARDTLGLSLTDELPNSLIGTLISWVAVQGEHPELALDFVLANFEALVGKQSPSFRNTFVSTLMGNFSDPARAEQLKNFAPAYANSGGRMVAERTIERILVAAEFIAQQLPAVDEWIRRRSPLP
jgi:aminopeptidase N